MTRDELAERIRQALAESDSTEILASEATEALAPGLDKILTFHTTIESFADENGWEVEAPNVTSVFTFRRKAKP